MADMKELDFVNKMYENQKVFTPLPFDSETSGSYEEKPPKGIQPSKFGHICPNLYLSLSNNKYLKNKKYFMNHLPIEY